MINGGKVPQVIEGSSAASNNTRVPFWCWLNLTGLNPNSTYHYFTMMDTTMSMASNGAGLPIVVNKNTRVIRRIQNPSMTSNTGFDSLMTDAGGNYSGWFGVEPTANGRFFPGNILYVKVMINNGAGGTTVANRLVGNAFQVKSLAFGTTSMSATQGSALWDSLNAAPKNFIGVYDNINAGGRPQSFAIVEDDSLYLRQFVSTAPFYRNRVDSLNFHWGTIIPNNLATGVNALVEYNFTSGNSVDTTFDSDGIWCFGTNTVNMSNGNLALYLNSTFVLMGNAMMPDTTWTSFTATFTVNSNSPNSSYSWNFGDAGTASGAVVTHQYLTPGPMNAYVVISTGGCSDTIYHTVMVMLTTGMVAPMPLSFQVMPNPTNGEFIITTRDNSEKLITVMNTLGEIISSQELTGNSLRIDLSGDPTGIYFIQVKDKISGKTGTKKIVLQ